MKKSDIVKLKELISSGWEINEEEGTVKNPVTGKSIKISTALGYDKNHPAYKVAVKAQGDKDLDIGDGEKKSTADRMYQAGDNKISKFITSVEDDDGAIVDKLEKMSDDELKNFDKAIEKGIELGEKFEDEQQDAFDPIDNFFSRDRRDDFIDATYELEDEDVETFNSIRDALEDSSGNEILQGIKKYQEFAKKHPSVKSYISDDDLKDLFGMATKLKNADDKVINLQKRFGGLTPYQLKSYNMAVGDEMQHRGMYEQMEESNIKNELKKLEEALTQVQKYQMDEPDHEGEMAKSQMLKTMKYSVEIMNMIDDSTNLPAWVQSKLTKIADYIGAVKHYMDSKTVRHVVTNMAENTKVEESTEIRLMDLVPVNSKKKINERLDRQTIKMMDGLHSYKKMDESLKTLVFIGRELTEEGFEKDEVIEYIQQRITKRLHVQL